MKVIVYITSSQIDGIQVRFRTSEKPAFHILEAGYFETNEDAEEFALVFSRGITVGGAESIFAVHESIRDEFVDEYPIYLNEMMNHNFDKVWEALNL